MATKDRDRIRKLREEANALRKKEEARKRRNRMFTQLGIVLGAVVVVAGIVALVVFGPRWFSDAKTPQTQAETLLTNSAGEETAVPIRTQDTAVVVGQDDAAAKVDYYFDFSCPHCVEYHEATEPYYEQMIADGDIQVTYHMVRFVSDYGLYAGSGAAGVLNSAPELFFDYVNGVFAIDAETQATWTYSDYAAFAGTIGVTDQETLEDISEGNYAQWITDATENARANDIPGTPSVAVNGSLLETLPTTLEEMYEVFGVNAATESTAATETPAE